MRNCSRIFIKCDEINTYNLNAPTIFAITTFQDDLSANSCGCVAFGGTYFNVEFPSPILSESSTSKMSAKLDFLQNRMNQCLILPHQMKNNKIFKSYSYLLAPAKKSSTFCSSLFRNANPLNMIAYFMKPNCELTIVRFRIKRI